MSQEDVVSRFTDDETTAVLFLLRQLRNIWCDGKFEIIDDIIEAEIPPSTFSNAAKERVFKALDDYVSALREEMYSPNTPPQWQLDACQALLNYCLLGDLIRSISNLSFQAMKDVGLIFKLIFRDKKEAVTAYLTQRPYLLTYMIIKYPEPAAAHSYGTILRQCARVEGLCCALFSLAAFYNFFDLVQHEEFQTASDAFATFTICLSKHPKIVGKFLLDNFDRFIVDEWNKLLMLRSYVTKRQALKCLRDILTARSNFKVMIKYVNHTQCLKVMTALLCGRKIATRLDAYHIFKIFILNPRKSPEIIKFVCSKKEKIIKALDAITPTPEVDKVIDSVTAMQPPPEPEKVEAPPPSEPAAQPAAQPAATKATAGGVAKA